MIIESQLRRKVALFSWLVEKLDNREIKEVHRSRGLFKISWEHGSSHGWTITEEAVIFDEWARYSETYREGKDIPDPIK